MSSRKGLKMPSKMREVASRKGLKMPSKMREVDRRMIELRL